MEHYMNLNKEPFDRVAQGSKTIELRLNDEKRQRIRVGDSIVFSLNGQADRRIRAEVTALYPFASFDDLFRSLPLSACGYTQEELASADPRDMRLYYSEEAEKRYGVLGIGLRLTDR